MKQHLRFVLFLIVIFAVSSFAFAQAGGPDPDDDGDGIPNSADSCPSEAGPSSNRGCPEVVVTPDPQPQPQPQPEQPQPEPTAAPAEPESVALPPLPSTGPCVVGPATNSRVNVRNLPSIDGDIVGVIEPEETAAAFLKIDGVEGSAFILTPRGFVAESVLRFGGEDCTQLPVMEIPTSTGPFVLRQDTDGDGEVDNQFSIVRYDDVLGEDRPDYDPTGGTIFWPPIDEEEVGLLLPAVQKVREAAARMHQGCEDVLIFNPDDPIPGCILQVEDFAIWCVDEYCFGQQTTLPLPIVISPTVPEPPAQTREHILLAVASPDESVSPVDPSFSPFDRLIFIPDNATGDDDDDCAATEVEIGPVTIEGCLILTEFVAAFCISDLCIYTEW